MNKIFIEAQSENTSECQFLKAVIGRFFGDKKDDVVFICMGGVDRLFSQAILNEVNKSVDMDDAVMVILDADTRDKGWGYAARMNDIGVKMVSNGVDFPVFLYPNGRDDGDVETLMEQLAQKERHQLWWDCFNDYEACVGAAMQDGKPLYSLPNRKAKLHTYISSQVMSRAKRNRLGSGNWLFDDADFWDLTRPELTPLLDFLKRWMK